MHDDEVIDRIRRTPWLPEVLARFDFELERGERGPAFPVHLANGLALEAVAGDSSGGTYLLVGPPAPRRPVVYVGMYGEGGLIAHSLHDTVAIMVGVPTLNDALNRNWDPDDGATVRAWIRVGNEDLREDWPEIDDDRARIRDALELPDTESLLEAMHRAMADEQYRPISDEHGERYTTMLPAGTGWTGA